MVSRLKDTLLLLGSADSDRAQLREVFRSAYDLLEAENLAQARMLLEQNSGCIAAVLADLPLSPSEEIRRLSFLCHHGTPNEIPLILFISPDKDGRQEELAFSLGATEVVLRPYAPSVVQRRVQTIIDLFLHRWNLETLVEEQSQTIRNTNQVMLDALSAIIEHRNTESGNHVLRIRRFTSILLEEVAAFCPEYKLTDESIQIISNAAALHDIGKISVPDSILNKPDRLTAEEYEIIKTHTTVGSQLVENLRGMGDAEYLRYAYNIALYHHERWDGNGYPTGLKGEDIPICAQAVGIADAFDALISPRVYKPAIPYDQAVNMILNGECGVFSPKLLECFKRVRIQLIDLAHRYADGYSPKSDHITLPLPGPEWKNHRLDSLQLSQVKYQALLHHMNDTVLELDLDNELYHVVYNPNPDLESLVPTASFSQIMDQLRQGMIHPDDAHVADEVQRVITEDFFHLNLRRVSFSMRVFNPASGSYQPYELVILRVNTGNPAQRIVIAIWHKAASHPRPVQSPVSSDLYSSPALYGLVSTALRCRTDPMYTIHAGSDSLFSLTGYTRQEIQDRFGSSLLNLIFPEDRSTFLSAMNDHLQAGGRTDIQFRLLRKDASPLWVLARSRLYLETDGMEYLYLAIRDNSQLRETIDRLQAEAARHQALTEQSEGVIFDLDLNADLLTCSTRWEEFFGYPPLSRNFLTNLPKSSHFHPDDLPALYAWVDALRRGEDAPSYQEVRIVNKDGKYIWCRIHARLQPNNHIVGILYDVDEFKRATLALKERAERDALTKLLNKASTQQLVSEYLNGQESSHLSALLILDLDNFKTVNDTRGHLYGDAVLSQLGSRLRSLFRANDIIGRIGGDEFLVFLKDLPDADVVKDRCSLLQASLGELLHRLAPDLNVSCSIGAAIAPTHASNYADLFRRADEALYQAKKRGKNRYRIYNRRDKYDALLENTTYVNARIDSDEQPNISDNSFIRFVFHALYESNDIEYTFDEILAQIGRLFNVSRAYIFENNEDNTTCSNTFEWCNVGVEPQKDVLQNISYITDIPGWPEVYDEHGLLYCSDVSELAPTARAILEPQGIKSMLHCAIMDNGIFRGYIGFDDCAAHRLWTQEQISLLQFLSEVMALFLLKKRTQDKVNEQVANLQSILDHQDAWVYVIDPDTYQLRFLNKKLRSLAPNSRIGMTCYSAFMDRQTPCPDCPLTAEDHTCVIENSNLGVCVRARSTQILWNGKAEQMITCHDVTTAQHS